MRDLELFHQYLTRARQHFLQQSHQYALGASETKDLITIAVCANRAQLCDQFIGALRELEQSPEGFIKKYLP